MGQLWAITSRNLKQYLRDKGAVFFSLMSMFIVLLLMFLFLGESNSDSVVGLLGQFPGRDPQRDRENADLLILCWTCAGIVTINAVTVTMSSLGYMIRDRESGRLNAILTAPIRRSVIAAGYVLSAWLSSVIVCTLTLAVAEVYCVISGMEPFGIGTHLRLLGLIGVNSFTYAAMMYLVASLVKTQGAWGGIGTVISTLVGFLGGIYFPIGALSSTIGAAMKCTPVIHGAALFRAEMTATILADTFEGLPPEVTEEFNTIMGVEIQVWGHSLAPWQQILILLLSGILFLALGIATARFGKKTDR